MKREKKSLKFKINSTSGLKRGRQVMKDFKSGQTNSPFTQKEKEIIDNTTGLIDPSEILSSIFQLEEKKRETDLMKKKAQFNKPDTQKKYYCKKFYKDLYKNRLAK